MASVSYSDVAITTFAGGLRTFDHILARAEEFAKENSIDPTADLAAARLVDDQLPLVFQVQNATRTVKINVERLTGAITQPFKDEERTLPDLRARIAEAGRLLHAIDTDTAAARANELVEV
jgi:uncharacterized protein